MSPPPRSVLILGGGTAGWMTANLIHRRWSEHGTRVSLIESSAIGIIGVGEGSTPQLKAFFDTLGIGSFATTTAIFRAMRLAPDELIPGTLNVGHTIESVLSAFVFINLVPVAAVTLISMVVASALGAWFGSGDGVHR